ncbi:MAG: flagellar biosynthesis regulator FlaF [Rhodospirillaceae bacterium]
MSEDLSPQQQVAFPFLEAAVRIDTAKQNPANRALLAQVLDDNVALWLYFKNLLLDSEGEIASDTKTFLIQASEFMIKSAQLLLREADDELMSRLVALNLNMSELLLQAPSVTIAARKN